MLKKLLLFLLIVILIFVTACVVLATSEGVESSNHGGEVVSEHHKTPIVYYIQWALILSIFSISLQYALKNRHKKNIKKEGPFRAYAIVGMVFLVFFLGYTMMDYHEPLLLGFLRLLLLFIGGVLVTFYGVLGRHDEAHH